MAKFIIGGGLVKMGGVQKLLNVLVYKKSCTSSGGGVYKMYHQDCHNTCKADNGFPRKSAYPLHTLNKTKETDLCLDSR